jgi:hypothetical protein
VKRSEHSPDNDIAIIRDALDKKYQATIQRRFGDKNKDQEGFGWTATK